MPESRKDEPVGNDRLKNPGSTATSRWSDDLVHDITRQLPNYELTELLEEKSAASIYRGCRVADGLAVVVKIPRTTQNAADLLLRCHHEHDLLEAINHPSVVRPVEVVQHKDSVALVVEDFEGLALTNWLQSDQHDLSARIALAVRITTALGAVHEAGIVHQNVCSRNILVDPLTRDVKLVDFSSARRLSAGAMEFDQPDLFDGNLAYISPEQTGRTNRRVDDRSDWYSLGMTLYELFCRQLPFDGADGLEWVHFHLAGETPPLTKVDPEIPAPLSGLVLKLLERDPENRYQSAAGIIADLMHCARELSETGEIAEFELGQHDAKERFDLPQTLIGREDETATLLEAFERVASGSTELIRVLGNQGSGKTALVQELQLAVTQRRGFFATGSCRASTTDQIFRPILDALEGLVSQVLTESEQAIEEWRAAIQRALSSNGRLIVDVLPELEHIIGKQPPVPPLPDDAARIRFESTFAAFIRVFATASHPLVLFLDDMHFADKSSRKLLQLILSDPASESLLVVETINRDDDERDQSPQEFDSLQTHITTITLDSLDSDAVARLVGATLRQKPDRVRELAGIISEKTAGKPLYIRRFLQALYDTGKITFDPEHNRFDCPLSAAEEAEITENVAQVMADKLQTLGSPTPEALRVAAVIGHRFDLGVLASVCNSTLVEVLDLLKPAREAGYIIPVSEPGSARTADRTSVLSHWIYAFAHEHIHRAAYALSEARERPSLHLAIGRALLAQNDEDQQDIRLLDVVAHLNQGAELIDSGTEKLHLAELNRRAGDRMRNTTAYEAAESFYRKGIELMGDDPWQLNRTLALRLHSGLINVTAQAGNLETALRIIDVSIGHAVTARDRAYLSATRVQVCMRMNNPAEAIAGGVETLRELGVSLPEDPAEIGKETTAELDSILEYTGEHGIDSLLDLPRAQDVEQISLMALLRQCLPAAFQTDSPLFGLLCCKMVLISIAEGNCRWSAGAYASISVLLGGQLERYQDADSFAKVGIALANKLNDPSIFPEAAMLRAMFSSHWVRPIDKSIELFEKSSAAALEMGDHAIATYGATRSLAHIAFRGAPFSQQRKAAQEAIELCSRIGDPAHVELARCYLHTIDWLSGSSPESDADLEATEQALDGSIGDQPNHSLHAEWALLMLRQKFLDGQYDQAYEAAKKFESLQARNSAFLIHTEYVFFSALTLAALIPNTELVERDELIADLNAKRKVLKQWAELCPANRLHMCLLVRAECARLRGAKMDAMRLYDAAIATAGKRGFLLVEALASELAARFWHYQKKDEFSAIYRDDAINCYERLGAFRKSTALRTQAGLPAHEIASADANSEVDNIDLAAVLKASQVIAGEIVLEDLLGKLVEILLECAGGDRIALILPVEGRFLIQGIKEPGDDHAELMLREPVDESVRVSKRIINYVLRKQEHVVLSESDQFGSFRADSYIGNRRPKSVLCTPIMHKGELAGIVYIENTKITDAFTEGRLQALDVLLSQIAVSIENAQLYAGQEEQARNIERANTALTTEIAERKRVEQQLSRYRDHLEELVAQRTHEVELTNEKLKEEAEGREQALKELEKSNEQIRSLAYLDNLTGLPNRRLLKEHLDKITARCKRKGLEFAVLFVDLDNFKLINDSIGHQAADSVLCDLSEALSDLIRAEDVLAMHMDNAIDLDATISISPITESVLSRLGGDEFVVLLPEIRDRFAAATVAQRILDRLERPFEAAGHEVFIAASVGIATFPDDGQSSDVLLRNADTAMYHAKQLGKGTYQYYSDEMNAASVERLTLESGLRKAIDENRLELHYQPQVDIGSGRIVGAEALIRWNDPVRGYISPATFVPIAETGGLILQLGEWILHEATRQAAEWRDQGLPKIPVAVNVSGAQIKRQDIASLVAEALQKSGLEPSALSIEITETSLMSVLDRAAEVLHQLRELGVSTALDDFGTGYSSLSYLKAFPLDSLKIDRSFIAEMLTDDKTAALTEAIVNMTRILNLKVVAEGIEDEEQLAYLRSLGCSTVQGYYFSPAVPPQEFARLLTAQPAHWRPGSGKAEDELLIS